MARASGCLAATAGLVLVMAGGAYLFTRTITTTASTFPSAAEQAWFTAARRGDVERLRALRSQGMDVDAHEAHHGRTALMRAAFFGHTAAVDALVEAHADVRATDLEGATALLLAARAGEAEVVTHLARAGADVNVRKVPDSLTPLFAAVEASSTPTVAALLAAGADPATGNQDMSPLERAIDDGSAAIVAALLGAGARPEPSGLSLGRDPLLHRVLDQCQASDADMIAALLEAGVARDARDSKGRTAHEWATYFATRPSARQACSRQQLAALVAGGVRR